MDNEIMNENIIGTDHVNILNNSPSNNVVNNGPKIFACGATDKNPETDFETPCETYSKPDSEAGWSDNECYCNALKDKEGNSRCYWRKSGKDFNCRKRAERVASKRSRGPPHKCGLQRCPTARHYAKAKLAPVPDGEKPKAGQSCKTCIGPTSCKNVPEFMTLNKACSDPSDCPECTDEKLTTRMYESGKLDRFWVRLLRNTWFLG